MTRDFEGKDIPDAVRKACLQLNLSVEQLHYEVLRKESKKILGFLGGKTALIRVTVEEQQSSDLVKELINSAFSDHLKKDDVSPEPPERKKPAPGNTVDKKAKISSSVPPASAPPLPATPGTPAGPEKKESVTATIDVEKVKKSLADILALMGVSVTSMEARLENHDCHMVLEEESGQEMLTSRKGEVLDALQYLLNKFYGVRGGRIYVDCGGFRSRHEHNIKKLTLKLGAKAKKTRKPVTINALNAHDRRIVHLLIQEDKGLHSRSKGDGEYKKIIIYPKNAYRHRDKNKAKTKAVKS